MKNWPHVMHNILFVLLAPLLTLAALQARAQLRRGLLFAVIAWVAGAAALAIQHESWDMQWALKMLTLSVVCIFCVLFGKWSTRFKIE